MVVGQPGKLVPVYAGCEFESHPRRQTVGFPAVNFFAQRKHILTRQRHPVYRAYACRRTRAEIRNPENYFSGHQNLSLSVFLIEIAEKNIFDQL